MEPNPYQSPRIESSSFRDESTQVAELERRVAELERCLTKSWICGPSIPKRVLAVWAYLMLGYVVILAIAFPFILLVEWLGL